MISCLTNFIGLEGVTTAPTSGRFVNELPGLETSQFDLIRKEETYDAEQAWDKIETRAAKKFQSQLQNWAAKYFSNYSYQSTIVTGQYEKSIDVVQGATLAGWFFNGLAGSLQNMSVVIPWVELYAKNNVDTSIEIYNASTGDLLDTIETTLTANTITRIPINREYPLWKYPNLFIAYDESEVQTINADDLSFSSGLSIGRKRVSKTASKVESNLVGVGAGGAGLIVCYNLNCSLDNYVCQRTAIFEEPFMYLLGTEFCNERVFSDRVSRYTLLDREQAKELRDFLNDEYTSSLEGVLQNLRFDNWDSFCFACEGLINYKVLLP